MIRLQVVREEDRDLLWNINQKYLYEMTMYYPDPMDANGNYHYGHFDEYFTDPRREAFFLYDNETMVGFAMLCPYSNIGKNPDYTMAEFTIFPTYRRTHYALEAANMILTRHQGCWEIKYNEKSYDSYCSKKTKRKEYCCKETLDSRYCSVPSGNSSSE